MPNKQFPVCFGWYTERAEECSGDYTSEDPVKRSACAVRDQCLAARRIGREELGIVQLGRARTEVPEESLVAIARHILKWGIENGMVSESSKQLRPFQKPFPESRKPFAAATLMRADVYEANRDALRKVAREQRLERYREAREYRDWFLSCLRRLWPRRAAKFKETARMGDWHYDLRGNIHKKSGPTLDIYVRSDDGYFRAFFIHLLRTPPGLRLYSRAKPEDIVRLVPKEIAKSIKISKATGQFGRFSSQWDARGKQAAAALAEIIVAADKNGVLW